MRRSIFISAAIAVVALAVFVDPAVAAPADQYGNKLGDMLKAWAGGLLFACAGFAGISALMRQDLGQAIVIFLVTVFVGGFVFAEGTMQTVITDVWQTATGASADAPVPTSNGRAN